MPKSLKIILITLTFLTLPAFVSADELLQKTDFFVDHSYDLQSREKITAVLQRVTDQLYFYLDTEWWDGLTIEKQQEVNKAIGDLTREFENTIYPILTLNYGSEWKPGIDKDNRITILIHPMVEGASGYFNPGDEYLQAQVIKSNQREMVYLNADDITDPLNKSFLAHEFTHLITFNQKDRTYGVSEEVWLNEMRAEYAPTLVGYNQAYQNSYLQKRVKNFTDSPRDSLTEWQGRVSDYGVINLFSHYLVDQYGKEILIDSLRSGKIGIASLNDALKKNGFKENFSQAFMNWTVAIFANDCGLGPQYCYLNDNLKTFKVTPFIYYLPTSGESTLSVGYLAKEWAGNWQKIIGGQDSIKLEFIGNPKTKFKVSYLVEHFNGVKEIQFLTLDQYQKGIIYLADNKIMSLTIMPSAQNKTSNFLENEPSYQFSWSATSEKSSEDNTELIQQLQDTIKELTAQILFLQNQLTAILGGETICQRFDNDLYYGMTQNTEVTCLQQFLKSQGSDIYPEGLVTGNFLSLTQKAVIRFQEKYASEILTPLGFEKGTGYFGKLSRQKSDELMHR